MKNNKGITLIALVITIIVILILASITISGILGQNGVIENSNRTNFRERVSMLQEELNQYNLEQKNKNGSFDISTVNATTVEQLKVIFPTQSDDFLSEFAVENGKLKYTGTNETKAEAFKDTIL